MLFATSHIITLPKPEDMDFLLYSMTKWNITFLFFFFFFFFFWHLSDEDDIEQEGYACSGIESRQRILEAMSLSNQALRSIRVLTTDELSTKE
jgi:hypothetical protein